MFKKYSLKLVQLAINQALSLDDKLPEHLKELDGKVIELIIAPLGIGFFIQFTATEILLLSEYDKPADTIIHSNPIGLIRLSLLPASKARSLFNDKIRISGDLELGQKVKKLFDALDIDWEGHLARLTGDVVAHQIGRFVRKGQKIQSTFSASMQSNLTEYLQEELRLFPCRQELEDFFHDIDELSLSVERLQAHIKQIQRLNESN